MPWKRALLAASLSSMALVPITGQACQAASSMQVIGFWANDASSGLSGLYKSPHAVTWFAPFWYAVDAKGGVVDHVDTSILSKARAAHVSITPLINDATGTQAFLKTLVTRRDAARNIADLVKKEHYQGVNIDFEPPHTSLAPELADFLVDLHDDLPRGSVVTMDVVPHSGGAYDYKRITPEINQYVLMSYDEHADGTAAGPVAATPWVQNILTRMEKSVPSHKIDLGVAVYGYVWKNGSTHAATVPYNAVTPIMQSHAQWDAPDQETYAHYDSSVAWWESLQGMNQKIHLARQDHLGGVALWHLGYANNSVYQLLLHQVGKQP